ncbi:MAG: fibronectin type III domain-containing protein, partial [Sphingobacteriales bacterium]
IPVTGNNGNLTLTALKVTSRNTTDADIATNGVKLWTGTSNAPVSELAAQSFNGGVAAFSNLTKALTSGTNYLWVTYNMASTSIVGNTVDASIEAGDITITSANGATAVTSYPAAQLNPAGSRTIDLIYCIPATTNGCTEDILDKVQINTLNNTSGCNGNTYGYISYPASITTTLQQTVGYTAAVSVGSASLSSEYIAIWADWNKDGDFDDAGEFYGPTANLSPGASANIPVTVPATATLGTTTMRVRAIYDNVPTSTGSCTAYSYGETEDYTITVTAAPACQTPTALAGNNIMNNQATFTWSAVTGATDGYLIRYKKTADATWTTATVAAGTLTYTTPSTLSINTAYEVQVQSVCSSSSSSTFSASVTFTTLCDAISVATTPYTQGFESVTVPAMADCFTIVDDNSDGTKWLTATGTPRTGTKHAQISYNTNNVMNDWMFAPGITMTAGKTYDVTFYYRSSNTTAAEKLRLKYGTSPTAAAMTNTTTFDQTVSTTTYTMGKVTVAPPATGTYFMGWQGYSAKDLYSIFIDDITIDEWTCELPGSVAVTGITTTAATLSWNAVTTGDPVQFYQISVQAGTAAAQPGPTTVTLTAPTYFPLTPATTYTAYVRSFCSGVWSDWTEGVTFTTPACDTTATVPYLLDFDSATVPAVPECTVAVAGGTGNNWQTAVAPTGFTGNVLSYPTATTAADSWFFTKGVQLEAGTYYKISYK